MRDQAAVESDVRSHLALRSLFISIAISFLLVWAPITPLQAQGVADVAGGWKGGEVKEYVRADSQIVYFSVRPDNSLSISMIFEVGPRSRAWKYDIDVAYSDGQISWPYHVGHLNSARDTMRVSKDYKGDRSEWMWVRARDADAMMEKFHTLAKAPFVYSVPKKMTDGWECGDPESVGIDRTPIIQFLEEVSQGAFGDFHGLLVVRHNKLVVEEYFAKNGEWHGSFVNSVFRDHCHHLASTTKCITSTLLGIAMDQGLIKDVHEPVMTYLTDHGALLSGGKEAVTIEHLLTMSSGIRRTPSDGRWLWADRDVTAYVLDQPLESEPGQRFVYSNGSAVLVGVILERATGLKADSFAREFLFRPLGISDYVWTAYPDGTVETEGGLALRPRDLAKIGQAFLRDGQWNRAQVIPANWVVEATKQRMSYSTRLGQRGYGYFWMQGQLPYNDGTVSSFFHSGDGGQLLMVVPELDMVIVLTGGAYGGFPSRLYDEALYPYLLPAVSP